MNLLTKMKNSKEMVVILVYFSVFLDNVLLTVVVPIIPDFLYHSEVGSELLSTVSVESTVTYNKSMPVSRGNVSDETDIVVKSTLVAKKSSDNTTEPAIVKVSKLVNENGRVGILLASKAFIQLFMNPIIGTLSGHIGYHIPLFTGCLVLLLSALLFAFGEQYESLLAARSLHGVASACVGVSGMSLVAEEFHDDATRSKIMGFVLGSIALAVLLGYPFGGLCYDFIGKVSPFIFLSILIIFNNVLQLFTLDLKPTAKPVVNVKWSVLLSDKFVLLIACAIWFSTSVMAILEPCLPIWLLDNIKPKKWQLGMVFIPDSVGYLVGTNCFGGIAYKMGQLKVAVAAMILVGVSSVMLPSAENMWQLILPHFGLGLGIGVVDAALVPLLANLVDSRYSAHYGSVYALQQMAVSLAYCLGPLVGGEMVRAVGFPFVMRSVGMINILYCLLLYFGNYQDASTARGTQNIALVSDIRKSNYNTAEEKEDNSSNEKNLYQRFFNSEDSD